MTIRNPANSVYGEKLDPNCTDVDLRFVFKRNRVYSEHQSIKSIYLQAYYSSSQKIHKPNTAHIISSISLIVYCCIRFMYLLL